MTEAQAAKLIELGQVQMQLQILVAAVLLAGAMLWLIGKGGGLRG